MDELDRLKAKFCPMCGSLKRRVDCQCLRGAAMRFVVAMPQVGDTKIKHIESAIEPLLALAFAAGLLKGIGK